MTNEHIGCDKIVTNCSSSILSNEMTSQRIKDNCSLVRISLISIKVNRKQITKVKKMTPTKVKMLPQERELWHSQMGHIFHSYLCQVFLGILQHTAT